MNDIKPQVYARIGGILYLIIVPAVRGRAVARVVAPREGSGRDKAARGH